MCIREPFRMMLTCIYSSNPICDGRLLFRFYPRGNSLPRGQDDIARSKSNKNFKYVLHVSYEAHEKLNRWWERWWHSRIINCENYYYRLSVDLVVTYSFLKSCRRYSKLGKLESYLSREYRCISIGREFPHAKKRLVGVCSLYYVVETMRTCISLSSGMEQRSMKYLFTVPIFENSSKTIRLNFTTTCSKFIWLLYMDLTTTYWPIPWKFEKKILSC